MRSDRKIKLKRQRNVKIYSGISIVSIIKNTFMQTQSGNLRKNYTVWDEIPSHAMNTYTFLLIKLFYHFCSISIVLSNLSPCSWFVTVEQFIIYLCKFVALRKYYGSCGIAISKKVTNLKLVIDKFIKYWSEHIILEIEDSQSGLFILS